MDRKLAAILAADVVGYSALMERDEAGTHRRLVAGRKELFEPQIARHHGRIFKLMGDGLLAEFGSIVDAVECAVSLQRGLAERNAAVADDQRFQVRIGLNLGEVIVEGDDRYGEGVNIAARLEQLAEPGGIWVSAKVAREVEKKLAFGFEAMGEQRVKNIAEPVTAYRVRLEGPPARPPRLARRLPLRVAVIAVGMLLLAAGAVTWFARSPAPEAVVKTEPALAEGKPSLVVLPFANLSDDKEQGYLADGITDDLTTDLARVPGLFVISRNAAFTYKGKAVQPAQIAKELGVRYILEGSTRRAGEDMRLNAQLIDAETGGHVWAERFDGQWADVFALQDKVVGSIAGALKLRLIGEPRQVRDRRRHRQSRRIRRLSREAWRSMFATTLLPNMPRPRSIFRAPSPSIRTMARRAPCLLGFIGTPTTSASRHWVCRGTRSTAGLYEFLGSRVQTSFAAVLSAHRPVCWYASGNPTRPLPLCTRPLRSTPAIRGSYEGLVRR